MTQVKNNQPASQEQIAQAVLEMHTATMEMAASPAFIFIGSDASFRKSHTTWEVPVDNGSLLIVKQNDAFTEPAKDLEGEKVSLNLTVSADDSRKGWFNLASGFSTPAMNGLWYRFNDLLNPDDISPEELLGQLNLNSPEDLLSFLKEATTNAKSILTQHNAAFIGFKEYNTRLKVSQTESLLDGTIKRNLEVNRSDFYLGVKLGDDAASEPLIEEIQYKEMSVEESGLCLLSLTVARLAEIQQVTQETLLFAEGLGAGRYARKYPELANTTDAPTFEDSTPGRKGFDYGVRIRSS